MDEITALNNKIAYLTGTEFQHWKEEQLDNRAAYHLEQAIKYAKEMTPEGCFKAAHHLLLYTTLMEMGNGAIAQAEVEKVVYEEYRSIG